MNKINTIIYFLIGSKKYKKLHHESFEKAINTFSHEELIDLINQFHLIGLLYEHTSNNGLINKLEPFVELQMLFNKVAQTQLNQIAKLFSHYNPVILKGASFWNDIYQTEYSRRVLDIDLLLNDYKNIMQFDLVMKELDYSGDRDLKQSYYKNDHYELIKYTKQIKTAPNPQLFNRKMEVDPYFGSKIRIQKDGIMVKLDIELHKGIFLYRNNSFPIITPVMLKKSPIEDYLSFMIYANIPYLALKIVKDLDFLQKGDKLQIKSVKLFADFIKLLEKSNQETLNKAIVLAKEWQAQNALLLVLNSVKELVPEIQLTHLPEIPNQNVLEKFIEDIKRKN